MNLSAILRAFFILCVLMSIDLPVIFAQNQDQNYFAELSKKKTLVYKQVNGEQQLLDIYYPLVENKEAKTPSCDQYSVFVYIHGGGWSGGDRTNKLPRKDAKYLFTKMLKEGIPAVSIDYRLARIDTSLPRQSVSDCKDALRYLYLKANELKLGNSEKEIKFLIAGESAGGHLSLMTALSCDAEFTENSDLYIAMPKIQDKIIGVISLYPATDFYDLSTHGEVGNLGNPEQYNRLTGALHGENRKEEKLLSPLYYLPGVNENPSCENFPKMVLIHGDADNILNINNSIKFYERAKQTNLPVEFIPVHNAKHGLGRDNEEPQLNEVMKRTFNFLCE